MINFTVSYYFHLNARLGILCICVNSFEKERDKKKKKKWERNRKVKNDFLYINV